MPVVALVPEGSGVHHVIAFVEADSVEEGVAKYPSNSPLVGALAPWEVPDVPKTPLGGAWGVDRDSMTVVALEDLDYFKVVKMSEVDNRTSQIIDCGFTFQDKLFSLSPTMQRNLSALSDRDLRNLLLPLLPLVVSTKDNLDSVVLETTLEFRSFYNAAFAYGMAAFASGNALKDQIRSTTHDLEAPDVPPNFHSLTEAIVSVQSIVDSR